MVPPSEQQQEKPAVLASVQNIVSGQTTKPHISPAASGIAVPPNTPEELSILAASQLLDKLQVQSDSSSEASSKSVMICKPMSKTQLEADTWKPSYKESQTPSLENDFA